MIDRLIFRWVQRTLRCPSVITSYSRVNCEAASLKVFSLFSTPA